MYWFRVADGSCEYGDIYLSRYDDLSDFLFEVKDDQNHIISDDILELHTVSVSDKDSIYTLLYGYDEKELISYFKHNPRAKLPLKEWDNDNIFKIHIDTLLSCVLAFVFSNCTFKSKFWECLNRILSLVVAEDDVFWKRVCFGKKVSPEEYRKRFIKFVSEELAKKVLNYLSEEQSFNCYLSLIAVRDVMAEDKYDELEKRCCQFFDKLAIRRLNDNINRTFSLEELDGFSIDVFFFYDEYFKLKNSNQETIRFIKNEAYIIYMRIANKLIENKHYEIADEMLNLAQECSLSEANKSQAIFMRESIKKELIKKEISNRKKKRTRDFYDKAEKFFSTYSMRIFKVLLYIAIALLIALFFGWVLSIQPLFAFSWKALIVSASVFVLYIILAIVTFVINDTI